ncbi:MAG: bifunctional glutamate N-acetyltransferase/amino-acid acetyltransferase ArgJ [Clostridium sp.]|nr:bifunctional glutamate N-acetyltransferase/amino-acid acetyltransferase ArgJ [Clostridium sp.]
MKININNGITSPQGFKAIGVYCGIKKSSLKKDLAIIYSKVQANACAVYTKNKVKGAPLLITKNHLNNNTAQAIIINSGNANTCNGDDGLDKAKKMVLFCGKALNIKTDDVLVASTGVIGVPLNIDPIKYAIPTAVAKLNSKGGHSAAEAIITTDTYTKEISIEFEIDGVPVVIGAMAKGSGMIHPNMATMLSFITTDLNIDIKLLKEALISSVNLSYNRISVDGDSSTNDMVVILANGLANNSVINKKDERYYTFLKALNKLNIHLAKEIAKDGEGATKLIECNVSGCTDEKSAKILAKSVINSNLVKAAIFGSDANWGRVLCALGYADVDFNPNLVSIYFASNSDSILVCENGHSINFDESKAKEILLKDNINININLHSGNASATAWGCDLTYDYIKINSYYRS